MIPENQIDDRLDELRELEFDYEQTPPALRGNMLACIDELRRELGLAPYAERNGKPKPAATRAPVAKPARDLSAARAVYRDYETRVAILREHQQYAEIVCRATAGAGMTPVEPLAKMGPNDGPLLCDHCGKPMILEGGRQHGLYADDGWARFGHAGWRSYIKGGMVIEVVDNATVRVYHGYDRRPDDCCTVRKLTYREDPVPDGMEDDLRALLRETMKDATESERAERFREVIAVVYGPDPGFGVNVPYYISDAAS